MVARTHPDGSLVVVFFREGELTEEIAAKDGVDAWAQAIRLITKRQQLQSGDVLLVRRADEIRVVSTEGLGDAA
jgi:hypothetical protein